VFASAHRTILPMLSDRPYMREAYQREKTPFLVWLISALIAVSVVELVFTFLLHTPGFDHLVALSSAGIRDGRLWTLLTYPFVHRGPLHLIGVVLALFFVGRELTPQVREQRLLGLAIVATLVGGLAWLGVHYDRPGDMLGATNILWCYFTVFACLFPNREVSFLVFFVLPITLRPKQIAWAMIAIDLVGLMVTELQPAKYLSYEVPHSAHLAAMLVGWIYYRYMHDANWLVVRARGDFEAKPARRTRKALPPPAVEVDVTPAPSREDLRAQIDRILDKINSHGFASLTAAEKRMLDEAKDQLSRR
jgi:membrane associated rhomboid family serine protease